jgi:hypothetical protein
VAGAIGELIADPPAQTNVRRAAERFTWTANRTALLAHLEAVAGSLKCKNRSS